MRATLPKSDQAAERLGDHHPTDEQQLAVHTTALLFSTDQLPKPRKSLVRQVGVTQRLAKQNLARRRLGALLMAMIAISSLFFRRLNYDVLAIMLLELLLGILLAAIVAWLGLRGKRNPVALAEVRSNSWQLPLVSLLVLLPWGANFLGRNVGGGNGLEIQLLGSLAWGSLAAAIVANTSRSISISVICSGFLTLFATFISDSGQATWFAYVWGILCLWWLVSNHWESIESQAATHVKTIGRYRIFSLLAGCLIFFVATALMSDRMPVLRKLKTELMPTSGGSSAKDSVGRGVGDGDALRAARKHPTSFAAVETDIFLESAKPSLFDVVGEELGWPRLNRQVERAQSLNDEEIKVKAGNFSEANKSSSSSDFSTQRHAPAAREKTNNIVSEAIMFWAGRSAAHLAVERFDSFDGVAWRRAGVNRSGILPQTPRSIEMNEQTWLYVSEKAFPNEDSPFVDALPESLKFTRFNSPIVPSRCGLQMWCVDKLDRADFFAVGSDGLISMPGREQVPDFTVVRMINSRIDRERVEILLHRGQPKFSESRLSAECRNQLDYWVAHWTKELPRGLEQVEAVIHGLRRDFVYDRQWTFSEPSESMTPLEDFLKNQRGPSYLFATAASQMLGRLGYETRFVNGFYANSKHFISAEREIGILPQDAHAWLELRVSGDYWIPLEPTPGYESEPLSVGWWYRISKARTAIFQTVVLLLTMVGILFLARGLILELTSRAFWPIAVLVSDRSRVVWLARLLDLRARFAGAPRQKNQALRTHLQKTLSSLPDELKQTLEQYFQAADRLCFGGYQELSTKDRRAIRQLWRHLTYFRLRREQRMARQNHAAPVTPQIDRIPRREYTHAIG